MLYADLEDVRTAYEGTIPDEVAGRVNYLLLSASARLTMLVPSLPARVTSGAVDADFVADIVVKAVLRQLRNPAEGMTTSQTEGPFSRTVSYGAVATAANRGLFDDQDLELLYPPQPLPFGSIQVSLPDWRIP